MTIEDLEYIFAKQRQSSPVAELLWFMLIDGDHRMVDRHPANDLESLLPMLSTFVYAGSAGDMPRFTKNI